MTTNLVRGGFWRRGLTSAERRRIVLKNPLWARQFEAAYGPGREPLPWPSGLSNAIVPLADAARRRVREAIATSPVAPKRSDARDALVQDLERALFNRLFLATSPTLVVELGAASEHGLLAGDSPEDRFGFFCDCLSDKVFAADLLAQYPTLVRRLVGLAANWESATLETLARLTADRDLLRQHIFGGNDPGAWTEAEPLGDYHRGGRTVQRIGFASGARLIYKPRPIAMEGGFLALTTWLNEAGLAPALRAAEVLDRGAYGWAKWVAAAPCADADSVRRYFRRQGANLALAYLLGAVDLHFENVVAAGEHPVIVDLETLFEATPPTAALGPASAAAFEALNDSVIRTLLLPIRIEGDADADGGRRSADVSALGYAGGEQSIYFARGWDQTGSDAMHMAEIRAAMPAATCLPELDGRRVPAAGHVEDIVTGLTTTYDLLMARRSALGAMAASPLGSFRGALARRVLRPTSSYARLLDGSWHPALAEDAEQLEAHVRKRLSAMDPSAALTPAVVAAETQDIVRGDIPYFSSRVGALPLAPRPFPILGRATRTLPANGGWEACHRRMERLSPVDRDRQVWMTRLSFVTFDTPLEKPVAIAPPLAVSDAIEAAARGIGDRLCALALTRSGGASWLFPTLDDRGRLGAAVVGFDLYDGLAGIAVFLAALWVRTGEARYRQMAEAALSEAVTMHLAMPRERISIGAFDGAGGLAWALAVVGRWLSQDVLSRQALEVVRRHVPYAADEPALDLISGRAGFLAAGLAVSTMAGDLALSEALGPCARSLGDLDPGVLPQPSEAGLAHGRAGIGLALARWAHLRESDQDFEAACGLLEADQASAAAALRGEPARENEHDGRAMAAWCRGGLGVALAEIRIGRPQATAVQDLVAAVAGMLARAEGAALCLCHGALGVLEFLEAARSLGTPGAAELTDQLADEAMARILGGELCADHYHRIEAPGLMRGLAGTGYALLRRLDPKRFPSVLTLEPC